MQIIKWSVNDLYKACIIISNINIRFDVLNCHSKNYSV